MLKTLSYLNIRSKLSLLLFKKMYAAPKHTSQTSFKCFLPIISSVLFFAVLVPQKSRGQVTSVTVSPTTACAGTNLTVTFSSATSGNKTYIADLSDATGSFVAPPIASTSGTFNSPTNATLTIAIPSTALSSSVYRVMVSASGVTSNTSASFTINAIPTIITQPSSVTVTLCQYVAATPL